MRKLLTLLLLTALLPTASGIIIHGEIYDAYLDPLEDVTITVNTTPKQIIVSKDGTYELELPKGTYLITAAYSDAREQMKVEETVVSEDDASYMLDLILFPDLSDDQQLAEDIAIEGPYEESSFPYVLAAVMVVAILVFMGIMLFMRKSIRGAQRVPDDIEDQELRQVISVIREMGRRCTQKDLRKQIPLSEAKISLLVSELVAKGKVEKIKRGRGNILVLRDKR